MHYLTLASLVGAVVGFSFSGAIPVLFADALGLASSRIGLLVSFLSLASVLQILVARYVDRIGRKRLLISSSLGVMLCGVPLILLPSVPEGLRWPVLVAGIGGFAILVQVGAAGWFPLLHDLVPAKQRGRFLGRQRSRWIAGATIFLLVSSLLLSRGADLRYFQLIFAGAIFCQFLQVLFFLKVPERKVFIQKHYPSPFIGVGDVFRNEEFRAILIYHIVFGFGTCLILVFLPLFLKESLGFGTGLSLAYAQMVPLLGGALSVSLWGYIVDRYGSRPVYVLGTVAFAAILLLWVFVSDELPFTFLLVPLLCLASGVFGWGLDVASLRRAMSLVPEGKSSLYLAVFSNSIAFSAGVGAIVGGYALDFFRDVNLEGWFLQIDNFRLMFLIAFGIVLFALYRLRWFREEGVRPAREVLSLFFTRPVRTAANIYLYTRAATEEERVDMTHALGETRSLAALDELINALEDPSFEVRQEAAWALGRMKNGRAIEPLRKVLSDPEYNIQPHAAWALGELTARSAAPDLLRALDSPDPQLRGNAALALGKLEMQELRATLLDRMRKESDPFVFTCFARALATMGVQEIIPLVLSRMGPDLPLIYRERLAATLGDVMWVDTSFYDLLRAEKRSYASQVLPLLRQLIKRLKRRKALPADLFRLLDSLSEGYSRRMFAETVEAAFLIGEELRVLPRVAWDPWCMRVLGFFTLQRYPDGNVTWEEALLAVAAAVRLLEQAVKEE